MDRKTVKDKLSSVYLEKEEQRERCVSRLFQVTAVCWHFYKYFLKHSEQNTKFKKKTCCSCRKEKFHLVLKVQLDSLK